MSALDAVVIGAGPNGLVAANRLTDAGWSVLVVEAGAEPGGAVRSGELLEPGHVVDRFSAFYPLTAVSPAMTRLGLERFGLRWKRSPVVLAHPMADGSCATLGTDLDATAGALDAITPGDGAAWRALHDEWSQVRDPLLETLLGPFPPVRSSATLALRRRRDLLEFARTVMLPVRRLGEERFAGEAARVLLAGLALHADLSPEAPLSGLYGMMLAMVGQDEGFPVPEGGAGRLTAALVERLVAGGGSVRCNAPVASIEIAGGRAVGVRLADGERIGARHAVLADVDAPRLVHDLVGADRLPADYVRRFDRFQWDYATLKVNFTLDAPIPWCAPDARRAGTVHLAAGVDGLTEFDSHIVRSLLPADPFVLIGQYAVTDPSRQPAGRDTVWAYTHVPRVVKGDAADGSTREPGPIRPDDVELMARRVEYAIERLAPGFRASIRTRLVQSPVDLETENANLHGGAIGAGTSQLHQQLFWRPVTGTGRPSTPIAGLFLASASAHPGAGVHGVCGDNAARAALAARRVPKVVSDLWSRPRRG